MGFISEENFDEEKKGWLRWQSHFDKEYREGICTEGLRPLKSLIDTAEFHLSLNHNPKLINVGVTYHLAKNYLRTQRKILLRVIGWVESPIERYLLEALIVGTNGLKVITEGQEFTIGEGSGYIVSPQYQIGRFRVDFFIQYKDKAIIVECDGRDSHSSKIQISKDKKREEKILELTDHKFPIIRFSGQSIWQKPFDAAAAIIASLKGEMA